MLWMVSWSECQVVGQCKTKLPVPASLLSPHPDSPLHCYRGAGGFVGVSSGTLTDHPVTRIKCMACATGG